MKRRFFAGLENKEIIKETDNIFPKISTDTRTIKDGDFYLPLKGANFDGEKFIDNAIESGAIGFVTTDISIAEKYKDDSRIKLIALVPDTLIAYMELAKNRIQEYGFKVVGITGSSGKTTTKEMVSAVLSAKFKTHKTAKNHNNEIGFCQTVFEAPEDTEVLILEMGMRGLGEIELITKYATPDIAIVTNVGTAHIGRLGSRENIAIAKCEIANFLKKDGTFIAQDDELTKSTVKFQGNKIFYSIKDVTNICQTIGNSSFDYKNEHFELPIEGNHNIENALAAINAALVLGESTDLIKKGLKNFQVIENRWNIERTKDFTIINDAYNANPESMRATIDTILNMYKDVVLILGNMGELGDNSEYYHSQIGKFINIHPKLDDNSTIITVGEFAKHISNEITKCKTLNFDSNQKVSNYILKNKNIGNILFFKGSRSMKLEEIIEEVKGDF